eukprot:567252-Amphidinium_carterae.1
MEKLQAQGGGDLPATVLTAAVLKTTTFLLFQRFSCQRFLFPEIFAKLKERTEGRNKQTTHRCHNK